MKKIFPVTHRHQVLKWSLENRGTYAVGGSNHTLVDLLQSSFCYTENPPVFQYYDTFEDPKSTAKNIPLMFHLFDDTARGLNAVFNVMLDVYQVQANKEFGYESEEFFSCIKQLLETIVSSNAVLNRFREVLFEHIIKFGLTLDSSKVEVSNFGKLFNKYLYSELENQCLEDEDIKIGFTLFLFLDFAIRILDKSRCLESFDYTKIKSTVIRYVSHTILSGMPSGIENTNDIIQKNFREVFNKFYLSLSDVTVDVDQPVFATESSERTNALVVNFLNTCEFHQSLTLFMLLDSKGYRLDNKLLYIEPDMFRICFYDMIRSVSKVLSSMRLNFDTSVVGIMAKVIGNSRSTAPFFLKKSVARETNINTIRIIFDDIFYRSLERSSISSEYIKHADFCKRLMTNSIGKDVEDNLFEDYRVVPVKERIKEYTAVINRNQSKKNSDDSRRLQLLFSIDNNNLWNNHYSDMSARYVARRIEDILEKFDFNSMFESIDISCLKKSRAEFKEKYGKKSNDSKAKTLINFIENEVGDDYIVNFKIYRELYDRINQLADNSNVWYGRAEAIVMLSYLDDAFVEFVATTKVGEDDMAEIVNKEQETKKSKSRTKDKKQTNDLKKELEMYLHFYSRYIIGKNDSIYETSRTLAKLKEDFYLGLVKGANQMIKSFKDRLSSDVDSATIEEFEELFSYKGE